MDMGFAIGFVVNLGHHITPFGDSFTAAWTASGVPGEGHIGQSMSVPAMPASVDAHQIELFSRKKNRMHSRTFREMFSAKWAVTAAFQYVNIFIRFPGITAVLIIPAFPAPE